MECNYFQNSISLQKLIFKCRYLVKLLLLLGMMIISKGYCLIIQSGVSKRSVQCSPHNGIIPGHIVLKRCQHKLALGDIVPPTLNNTYFMIIPYLLERVIVANLTVCSGGMIIWTMAMGHPDLNVQPVKDPSMSHDLDLSCSVRRRRCYPYPYPSQPRNLTSYPHFT